MVKDADNLRQRLSGRGSELCAGGFHFGKLGSDRRRVTPVSSMRAATDYDCARRGIVAVGTAFRNLGIFQENVVNCILRDIVKACKPVSVTVTGV